jgi:hypothetical protein
MANPTYFTVVADFKSVVVDLASDVDADPQLGPVTAKVTFTPVLANGDVILASSALPRPTMFVPAPIVARIDTDGRLKLRVEPDGDRDDYATRSAFPGTGSTAKVYWAIAEQKFYRWTGSVYVETYPYAQVRLLADTELLNLASDLYYRVSFSDVVFNGSPGYINSFTFQAPASDIEINLVNVARVPGQPAAGITKGDKGDRGYSFVGLIPAGDGTSVVGLIETADGVVPAGDPIPISLAYNSTVTHATVASTPRPPVSVAVIWIGSAQPTYAIDGDVWLDTSGTAPSITTTTLNGLNIGATFNQILVASGTTPLVWSVSSGSLPAGLTFSTAGSLYGSPTSSGSYNFTIQALNAFGNDTQQFTGTIGSAIAPTINTTQLGALVAGTAFSLTLSVSGSLPVTFAVQSGSLPTGLSLNASSGAISGAPSVIGSYSFTIRATNSAGYDDQAFTGSVTGVAPTITTTSLGLIYRAFAVSQTLAVTGTQPVTFAVQSGSLPTGLSLNTSTGVISGTPTVVGSYSFTIRATNSYGTDDQAFTGSVLQSTPVIAQTSLNAISLGSSFSQTLTLTTGGPTITWSIQSGALPTGLSLNTSTGTISGTATAAGTYTVTILASNGSEYDDQVFTGTVGTPTFDSAGTGGTTRPGTSSVASGTHTATAGATVLVYVNIVTPNANQSGVTVTYGGTTMTQIDTANYLGQWAVSGATGYSWISAFKLSNAPAGAQTVTVTGSSPQGIAFESVSYRNITTVGSLQKVVIPTGGALSQTVTSATGHIVSQSFSRGTSPYGGASAYSGTVRVNKTSGSPYLPFVVGDTPGAATVTITATVSAPAIANLTGGVAVSLS